MKNTYIRERIVKHIHFSWEMLKYIFQKKSGRTKKVIAIYISVTL
jgi:hypothetical protein